MSDEDGYNSETLSNGLFHSVTKITIVRNTNDTSSLDINITNSINRWQTILIVSGCLFFGSCFLFVFYKLCQISVRSVMTRSNKRRRKRQSPQEEAVNEILSNSGARQILSSLARTAINSQTSRRQTDYQSQMSVNSVGEVLDISERVVRVSFAPAVSTRDNSDDEKSIGGASLVSGPPAYDSVVSDPPTYTTDNELPSSSEPPSPPSKASSTPPATAGSSSPPTPPRKISDNPPRYEEIKSTNKPSMN